MKVSRNWLQTFFEKPLPEARALADALTFHAFEIESVEGDVLDVKITPNRGHDALSHRGIAKELSAVLGVPLKNDPLRQEVSLAPATNTVSVAIKTPLCARYIAGYIKGVKVGPSPEWLRANLEAVGQKSINNVVDATNYVMFNIGQPLHAFDAGKLSAKGGEYAIVVCNAKKGEKMFALDDKEYSLNENTLVIADANANAVIGIAGVKGGKPSGVDEATADIILESANFDGVSVRRTAAALKLRTDASERFQQVISPELAVYGARAAADLIVQLACPEQGRGAGEECVGFTDEYPNPQKHRQVSVSTLFINNVLGTALSDTEIADVFRRLNLPHANTAGIFTVTIPFERLDLTIPEDLAEEVGRVIGYDKVPTVELPSFPKRPEVNQNFYAAEHAREELTAKGYSEVFTSVFSDKGERQVLNKVGGERPYLRANLADGLRDALEKNVRNKDLLGLKGVKLFEIGTMWRGGKEEITTGAIAEGRDAEEKKPDVAASAEAYENLPISRTQHYQPFSKYPFIVRDIALWVSADTKSEDVLSIIRAQAGDLLVRSEKFDEFKKGDKTSYAFRLVFQSFEKTLTDAEAHAVMERVYAAVKEKGWQVR